MNPVMEPRNPKSRRTALLGVGLDGAGLGPKSADGVTRVTQGEDYLLLGGSEPAHEQMQDVAETVAEACRDEGTTLGKAPAGLVKEILSDLSDKSTPPRQD